ncbi:MAG TPA: winged helix-turn-helix domain-containing protein [Nitrososphaerales archaeon]|nr:winged helix-turn-helix domain-containing protein [Nitrososphaerales archaeon]HUK75877.1 winged helix-turn-helix domain-containing protein [Nitrososphaerales archaeon]
MYQALETQQLRKAAGRRSAFEVMMDVLRSVANGDSKPTHIMYRSNTSWLILQRCLAALEASQFVTSVDFGQRSGYEATEKGRGVLHDYLRLVESTSGQPVEAVQ